MPNILESVSHHGAWLSLQETEGYLAWHINKGGDEVMEQEQWPVLLKTNLSKKKYQHDTIIDLMREPRMTSQSRMHSLNSLT